MSITTWLWLSFGGPAIALGIYWVTLNYWPEHQFIGGVVAGFVTAIVALSRARADIRAKARL